MNGTVKNLVVLSHRKWWVALAVFGLFCLVLAWWEFLYTPEFFADEPCFVELIRSWGAWGAVGSVGLMILHSFVPFPAEALALANGMVYGAFWGSLVTWVGAMLGAMLAFACARVFGQPFVRRILPPKHWRKIESWSGESAWYSLLVARLIPVIAFNLINYAAGLTTVSFWTFFWTTAIGILPLTILMGVLGENMLELPWWAWLLLVAVALLAGMLWKVFTRKAV